MNVKSFKSMNSNYSREKVFFWSTKSYELQFLNFEWRQFQIIMNYKVFQFFSLTNIPNVKIFLWKITKKNKRIQFFLFKKNQRCDDENKM